MTNRMKWLGLGGLVLIWIILLYNSVIDVPPPEEVPLKYQSGKAVILATASDPAEEWAVHSLRAQERRLPETPKRNIFATLSHAVDPQAKLAAQQGRPGKAKSAPSASVTPPVPPPPTPEELARQQEALAAQAAQEQEALRRKQLQEQMAQYRYLGYVNQNGVQKAFLGKGREIYILREGETLEGKFHVALIEATTVKLLDNDSKLETILKLKKEEASLSGT